MQRRDPVSRSPNPKQGGRSARLKSTVSPTLPSTSSNQKEPDAAWSLIESEISKRMNPTKSSTDKIIDSKENEIMIPSVQPEKKDNIIVQPKRIDSSSASPRSTAWDLEGVKGSRNSDTIAVTESNTLSNSRQSRKSPSFLTTRPLGRISNSGQEKQPMSIKSPVKKGAKGALSRLIKSFAKEPSTSMSSPLSNTSKRSFKTFDFEEKIQLVKQNPAIIASARSVSKRRERRTVTSRKTYEPTSEAQQRKWLHQVIRSIRDGASLQHVDKNAVNSPTSLSKMEVTSGIYDRRSSSESGVFDEPSIREPFTEDRQQTKPGTNQNYGAYSTFDDEQSVSSMELLFNWLTCRENSFEKGNRSEFSPEGMEFDVLTHSSDPYAQHGICR